MFVAYNIPPDSVNPALVDDVYADKIPLGDYYYYVACDESGVMQCREKQSDLVSTNNDENACISGARVTDTDSIFIHEVNVGFEKDLLQYGQSIIDYERSNDYDNFYWIRNKWNTDAKSVGEFIGLTPQLDQKQLQMDKGEDWAAVATFQNNDAMYAEFEFVKVDGGRLIQIRSRCRSLDTIIDDLINPWHQLIAKYRDMPMNIFTGAEHWWVRFLSESPLWEQSTPSIHCEQGLLCRMLNS